jgi:hypothetical protein
MYVRSLWDTVSDAAPDPPEPEPTASKPEPTASEPEPAAGKSARLLRLDEIRANSWPSIIAVSTVAVAICTLVQADPLIRGPLVLWFSLVCTGMAWVRVIRITDPLAEAAAAVALSVALSGLAAAAFLYSGHWSPNWTLVVLQAVTLAGVFVDRRVNGIR